MEARKKKQAKIRKADALHAHSLEGHRFLFVKVGQKRKQPTDVGPSSKKVQGPFDCLDQVELVQNMLEPPRHGVSKC